MRVFICFSHQRHYGCFDIFFIRRCGGDNTLVIDLIAFLPPDDLLIPVDCMLTATYIFLGFGGLLFYCILAISICCHFCSSIPRLSLLVPSLLGGFIVELHRFSSTSRTAVQCQVGPYARFIVPFDW